MYDVLQNEFCHYYFKKIIDTWIVIAFKAYIL